MPVIVSLVLGLVLTPVAAAVARRTGIVDRPGPLKVHDAPMPYLGGAAIFASAAPWLVVEHPALLVPLGGALGLGIVDDARGLAPRHRLLAEVAIGVVVAVLVDGALPVALHGAVAVLTLVVLVNGVNVIDGLDGLAAGVSLAALAGLAAATDGDDRTIALALAGATAGFLWHNRPPARIYLGDGGSYLLGTALAVVVLLAWSPGRPTDAGVAAVLAVALPAGELIVAVVRRAAAGRPLMQGDREHSYDRLVDRGWRPATAALACVAVAAGLSGIGALAVAA